ncbi:unnamed protein product, partial [Rotaria sordida]
MILHQLDDFEADYQSKNAIQWYTRSSFLYSTMNQVFRQQHTELIFLYGIILQDIYKDLNDRFKKNRLTFDNSSTTNMK